MIILTFNSTPNAAVGQEIISTRNLSKSYRRFEKEEGLTGSFKSLFHRRYVDKDAVIAFDLSIAPGEFVGLIGPNGAGKTTLTKMLTGIIAPSGGEVSVLGYYPNDLKNDFKRQIALVMGQKSQLFFELTPADTFSLYKELYAIPETTYRQNVAYFVELFGIAELLDVQVRTLSLGERMKMELIVALLHEPGVLFLDEPTIGLDTAAQRQMRLFLKEVNIAKGTTILLTSHYMDDVLSLCQRSVVMGGGRKLYDGPTDKLFEAYQTHKKITVSFASETFCQLPDECAVIEAGPFKTVFMVPKKHSSKVLADLMRLYTPADISAEEEDIGAVVERIYTSGGAGL